MYVEDIALVIISLTFLLGGAFSVRLAFSEGPKAWYGILVAIVTMFLTFFIPMAFWGGHGIAYFVMALALTSIITGPIILLVGLRNGPAMALGGLVTLIGLILISIGLS